MPFQFQYGTIKRGNEAANFILENISIPIWYD